MIKVLLRIKIIDCFTTIITSIVRMREQVIEMLIIYFKMSPRNAILRHFNGNIFVHKEKLQRPNWNKDFRLKVFIVFKHKNFHAQFPEKIPIGKRPSSQFYFPSADFKERISKPSKLLHPIRKNFRLEWRTVERQNCPILFLFLSIIENSLNRSKTIEVFMQ